LTTRADRRIRSPLVDRRRRYSHSIVAGGFEVTSRTTRFTPGISLTIRAEIVSSNSFLVDVHLLKRD